MALSLFYPLDQLKPSQILSQYSEWIYFTLILVFFISISGITLRKHFNKPYVKPLIISVGLMLTVGVFKFRGQLITVFEGWGILGMILLVVIVATIPYGLCRGFGLAVGKAFYLTYILFYILSWVQFPGIYHSLGDKNLGIINLALLILFFVAIFKVVRFSKLRSIKPADLAKNSSFGSKVEQEIEMEDDEKKLIKKQARKMTKAEIHTVKDIAESLAEIQRIIDTHRNNLQKEERERIAHILGKISKAEGIFMKNIHNLQKLFRHLNIVDEKHLRDLKERMVKVTGKEKRLLKAEIAGEEEKLEIDKAIFEFEKKLGQSLNTFNQYIMAAVDHIKNSAYPYDAKPPLTKARMILKDIFEILEKTKTLEEKVIKLTKMEKKLLKKEKEDA